MSFSANVKTELLGITPQNCCEAAFFSAVLLFGREFSPGRLSLLTENSDVARVYSDAVRFFSGFTPEIEHTEGGHFKITVDDARITEVIFTEAGMTLSNAARRINFNALSSRCCRGSFLRGAFAVCGTVTDPDREYHMEFACPSKHLAQDLITLIEDFGITPKQTTRSGAHIVYIKSSSDIEDMLGLMGATENAMAVMGAKMYKDIRNTINRKVNFENANIARSIAAANRQYEAIMLIAEKKGLDSLPKDLRVLAEARLENREAGTAELAKILGGDLTVSGVNHRFKRIMQVSQELEDR